MNMSESALKYYELIRQGMNPAEAFKQAFPDGIPTQEDRLKEAADAQQDQAIGQIGGLLVGGLATDAIASNIAGEPSVVGSILGLGKEEAAKEIAKQAATQAVTEDAVMGALGEGVGSAVGGGGAYGGAMAGTAAEGAMSGQGALMGALGEGSGAVPMMGPQWGAALPYMALPLALATVAPAIAKSFRDDTESSRQLDPRIDLAGIAQSLPGGENMSEEQLMGAMEILDQQGRLHKGGFMRIADPTEENPLGSVADAVPAIIRSDRVMNRLKGDAFGENKYKSGFEYMQDLMMDRNNAHLSRDPIVQGLLNQSAPEGYEGKLGSDLIASLAQYKDPNTAMTFNLMPQGVEAQPVPTPEEMAAQQAPAVPIQAQPVPKPVSPMPAPIEMTPGGNPVVSNEVFNSIGDLGQGITSAVYRDMPIRDAMWRAGRDGPFRGFNIPKGGLEAMTPGDFLNSPNNSNLIDPGFSLSPEQLQSSLQANSQFAQKYPEYFQKPTTQNYQPIVDPSGGMQAMYEPIQGGDVTGGLGGQLGQALAQPQQQGPSEEEKKKALAAYMAKYHGR